MKFKLFLFLLIVSSSGIFAKKTLTLSDAISISLNRNTALLKGSNSLGTSRANIKNAYGQFLPSLGFSGDYNWQRVHDNGGAKLVDQFGQLQTLPAYTQTASTYSLGIGGQVTLFNGLANLNQYKKSKEDLSSAKLSLERSREDVAFQAISYYYDILNAEELLKAKEENLKYNQSLLQSLIAKKELGSLTEADVLAQRVQAGNAELGLIQQKNSAEIAKTNLLNFLGLDVLEEYEFEDPTKADSSLDSRGIMSGYTDIKSLAEAAVEKRADYKSQQSLIKSSKLALDSYKGDYYPSLKGNYSYGTNSSAFGDLFSRTSFSVGLNLSVPIFTNYSSETQTEIGKIQIMNNEEDLRALERQIRSEVKQGVLNLNTASAQLDVSGKTVTSALENRTLAYEKYKIGSGTLLDVQQADKNYIQALTDRINARFEFLRLSEKLKNYLGELNIL